MRHKYPKTTVESFSSPKPQGFKCRLKPFPKPFIDMARVFTVFVSAANKNASGASKGKLVSKPKACDVDALPAVNKYVETVVYGLPAFNKCLKTAVDGMPAVNKHIETAVDGMPAFNKYLETAVDGFPAFNKYLETTVDGLPALDKRPKTVVDSFSAVNKRPKTAVDAFSALCCLMLKSVARVFTVFGSEANENASSASKGKLVSKSLICDASPKACDVDSLLSLNECAKTAVYGILSRRGRAATAVKALSCGFSANFALEYRITQKIKEYSA